MKKILCRPRRSAGALSRILIYISNHLKIMITPCFPLFIFFSVFSYFYFLFQLNDLFFAICAMIKIICVIFFNCFLRKIFCLFFKCFSNKFIYFNCFDNNIDNDFNCYSNDNKNNVGMNFQFMFLTFC